MELISANKLIVYYYSVIGDRPYCLSIVLRYNGEQCLVVFKYGKTDVSLFATFDGSKRSHLLTVNYY